MTFSDSLMSVPAFSPIKMVTTKSAQIEVIKVPISTDLEEIKTIFGKYGLITSISMNYSITENTLTVYLSYENESNCSEALMENERIVGNSTITVRKIEIENEQNGKKRKRLDEDSGCWGSSIASTPAPESNGWGSEAKTGGSDSWGSSSFSDSSRGRGRGRGGGGRGGGGGRSCFNCGEEGHMSRECSKPKVGRSGPVSCFKCGEEGHMSRECPKGGGRSCFNCGEEGHMSRECPKPRDSSRGRGRGRGRGASNADTFSSGAAEWASDTTSSTPASTEWGTSSTPTPVASSSNDDWA